MIRTTLCAFLLAAPLLLHARQAQQEDTLSARMQAIEVVGLRSVIGSEDATLSFSLTGRGRAEMNQNASLSLSELGEELPGLWVNNRRNYALGERMTIRGLGWRAAFGVRGIQVVLDGIPLTVADGQSMIDAVDPAFVRRAEVIRGPASSWWGNSSGGVLYLSTDPGHSAGESLHLRTLGGSYGLLRTEAQYHTSGERQRFNVYASYLDDPGFRDYSSARLWRTGLTGSATLSGGGILEYSGTLVHMPFAEHPSGLTAGQAREQPRMAVSSFVDAEAGKTITQGQAGLRYLKQIGPGSLSLSAYGIGRDLSNPLPFGIITVDRLAGGVRAALEGGEGRLQWKTGADLKLQRDDRAEYDNDGGSRGAVQIDQLETVWNQALFGSLSWETGKVRLLGSLRFDRLTFSTDAGAAGERSFHSLSPGAGIHVDLGSAGIYGNLGTSFEAPTTTELVNRPDGQEGFNPSIGPERTVSLETGVRGEAQELPLTYEVAFYYMWIHDLLFPYQLEADGPVYYRNQGETAHRGAEARVQLSPAPSLSLGTTYTLTDARFLEAVTLDGSDLEGKSVPGVARHRINTVLRWNPGKWRSSLSHEFVSRHPVDNLNTGYNEAYHVFDATLSYRSDPGAAGKVTLQPFLQVNNLLDERYNGSVVVNAFGGRYFEPAAGRNWQFGLSLDF